MIFIKEIKTFLVHFDIISFFFFFHSFNHVDTQDVKDEIQYTVDDLKQDSAKLFIWKKKPLWFFYDDWIKSGNRFIARKAVY